MTTTTNTTNSTRTTVKIRTTSGAEHLLNTYPYLDMDADDFLMKLNNHKNTYGDQLMRLSLIHGAKIILNPAAIESFSTVPVPRHTSVNIRKGSITYGDYVDGIPAV